MIQNNAFTETTIRILRDQIKHKFSRFNSPNDTLPVDVGDVPPEKPLVLIEINVPGSLGGQEVQDCTIGLGTCVFPNDYDIQELYVSLFFKLKGNSVSVADLKEYVNLNAVGDRFMKVTRIVFSTFPFSPLRTACRALLSGKGNDLSPSLKIVATLASPTEPAFVVLHTHQNKCHL